MNNSKFSKNNNLPQCVKIISADSFFDERGNLSFVENCDLPFDINRVFWISNVPSGQIRGNHAHTTCAEILFPIKGAFDVFTDDGITQQIFHLDNAAKGLYIGPYVWCRVENFSNDSVCVVLCSHSYIKEGYINTYEEFRKAVENSRI